jgi:hydrogenase-4 membrane subunit HyfE
VDDVRDGRADLSISETLDRVTPHLTTLALAGLLAGIAITFGFILLIVPGLFLLTIWLLIVPAIMLENCGVSAAFARSQELVRGYGWSVFGVIILTVLIFIGVGIVFAILEGVLDSRWLSFALNIVLQTVTAPFLALAWTITYYELRDLKGAEPTAAV